MDIGYPSNSEFRIGVLLFPGFALMSYASLVEPLRAANLLSGKRLFKVVDISAEGSTVRSSSGALIPAVPFRNAGADYDLALAVAGGDPLRFNESKALSWLRTLDRKGVSLGGVSGGPVILARAGLMTGRRMTVHWEHAPVISELHPNLHLERTLFVVDRDRITCAGGTAPMDLIHSLVASMHGSRLAGLVTDWFMHTEVRNSRGLQRAGIGERYGTVNRAVNDALELMETHIADPLTLSQIAELAGISPRQMNRLFRREIGEPAMSHYMTLRLEVALGMLRKSALPISEIADATGFADHAHFANAFRKWRGTSPSAARKPG